MNEFARHWDLDPAVLFLNHGSFGACPRVVLEAQAKMRARLERQPVRFFVRDLEGLLAEARAGLAAFIHADADDLAFVPNATTGANTVLRSLDFRSGDEILVTDHGYNAVWNTAGYVAGRTSAKIVVAPLLFPVNSPGDIVTSIVSRVTARTRLAIVDHITSPTGLVLPVDRIVKELSELGVDTLVDGAHAPGMIPLDIRAIGAAYYTGNCHKWVCAPKGAAFLQVRRDRQERIHPAITSHGANAALNGRSRFRVEFDWMGTDDPTAFLAVPDAIRFMGSLLPGGWPELMKRNHALAMEGRGILCTALGIDPPAPEEMIGTLVAVPVADGTADLPKSPLAVDPLQDELMNKAGIEVPVMTWPAAPQRLLRISAQIYNSRDQYETLAAALRGYPPNPAAG